MGTQNENYRGYSATGGLKKLIMTGIAVIFFSLLTGFFLGGGLMPSQANQTFNVQTSTSNEVLIRTGGGNIDTLTTVYNTVETTPHGWFHNYAANLTPVYQMPAAAVLLPSKPNEIYIQNREYRPTPLTVPAGTTVTWYNKDPEEHTVTSDTGLFNADMVADYGTFSYTFNTPGVYPYHCDPHKEMLGKVIVTAAPVGADNTTVNTTANSTAITANQGGQAIISQNNGGDESGG